MRARYLFIVVVAVLLGSAQVCLAKEGRQAYLFEKVALDFEPSRGYFFVDDGTGKLSRKEAVKIKWQSAQVNPASQVDWIFAAALDIASFSTQAKSCLLILGQTGNSKLINFRPLNLNEGAAALLSTEQVRERLLDRREVLKSWQIQIETQERSLSRLKEDAETVARLERIVALQDDLESGKRTSAALSDDIKRLEDYLSVAKMQSKPKGFSARERQLSKQLLELAEVAKQVESGEFTRRSQSEQKIQAQLAVIEQARSEDFDYLQREVIRLRKKRMELEGGIH